MPDRILLQDLTGIWANPILPMLLAFIFVPIGLAFLCVGSAYVGQILSRDASSRQFGVDRKRLRVPHRPRGVYRPHRWRNDRHPESHVALAFRRGGRGGR